MREATQAVAIILSNVAPYTAEEMWERLGYAPSVALAPWPIVDPTLLVEDEVECIVQINGKMLIANSKRIVGPTKSQAMARSESPRILRATDGGVAWARRVAASVMLGCPDRSVDTRGSTQASLGTCSHQPGEGGPRIRSGAAYC
ncbi:MAG: class I tRNA ligase family protein [Limnohabitans sp.]